MRLTVERWQKELITKYPNEKFSFYDFKLESRSNSFPLVYYLYFTKKVDPSGRKIGVTLLSEKEDFPFESVTDGTTGYQLFVLSGSDSALEEAGWFNINPGHVYNSTENWRKSSGK